jgi:hypothetical protein
MGNPLPARYPTSTGPGGDFYPWVRGWVRKFTRYPCQAGMGMLYPPRTRPIAIPTCVRVLDSLSSSGATDEGPY